MNQKQYRSPMFSSLKNKWKNEKQDRHSRSKDVRKRLVEDGKDIFKKFNVKKVILFGSVLENRMSLKSDIDILVDPLPADLFYSFHCQLEEKLNLTIDLHTMGDDSKFIEKILQRGEVVYEV